MTTSTSSPTDVVIAPPQFRLRHVMLLLLVASIYSALVAPTLRGWNALQWSRFAAAAATLVLTFLAAAQFWSWLRSSTFKRHQAAIKLAGPIVFGAPLLGFRAWRRFLLPVKSVLVVIAFMGVSLLIALNEDKRSNDAFTWFHLCGMSVCVGLNAWVALASLATPATVYVGTQGLVIEGQFRPWNMLLMRRDRDRFLFRWLYFTCVVAVREKAHAEHLSAYCDLPPTKA